MAEQEKKNAAIAAAIILIGFGTLAYFLPSVMLAVGAYSKLLAILVAAIFLFGIFAVLWLRSRFQKRN